MNKNIRTVLHTSLLLAASALLVACPGQPAVVIKRIGMVTLLNTPLGISNSVLATAVFGEVKAGSVSNPLPEQAFCAVISGNNPGGIAVPSPVQIEPLQLGDELIINKAGGEYAKLQFNTSIKMYLNKAPIFDAEPITKGGLSIDIAASNNFPKMSANFPASGNWSFSIPKDQKYTKDSTFTWQSDKKPNNRVIIFGDNGKTDGTYAGFSCMVPDTGSFSFPEATKTELTDKGLAEGRLVATGLVSTATVVSGDSALFVLTGQLNPLFAVPLQR
jgi:hypothetical protein